MGSFMVVLVLLYRFKSPKAHMLGANISPSRIQAIFPLQFSIFTRYRRDLTINPYFLVTCWKNQQKYLVLSTYKLDS
jgi:hypothetical protein